MKFRDVHEDESVEFEREPTGLIVNDSGVFEMMDNITIHLLAMEEEITNIYFKTIAFCVLFTVINLILVILINLVMNS